jgi:hypothetical protein
LDGELQIGRWVILLYSPAGRDENVRFETLIDRVIRVVKQSFWRKPSLNP